METSETYDYLFGPILGIENPNIIRYNEALPIINDNVKNDLPDLFRDDIPEPRIINYDDITPKIKKGQIVNSGDFLKNKNYAPLGTVTYKAGETMLADINRSRETVEARIKMLLDNGRRIIRNRREFRNEPLGSLVSYVTKENLYRSGGFLKKIEKDYFVIQGGTYGKPISFTVQFNNVHYVIVGSPIRSTQKKLKTTNFPVSIGDKVVYYARDNYDRKRFKMTEKYKNMEIWKKQYESKYKFIPKTNELKV